MSEKITLPFDTTLAEQLKWALGERRHGDHITISTNDFGGYTIQVIHQPAEPVWDGFPSS